MSDCSFWMTTKEWRLHFDVWMYLAGEGLETSRGKLVDIKWRIPTLFCHFLQSSPIQFESAIKEHNFCPRNHKSSWLLACSKLISKFCFLLCKKNIKVLLVKLHVFDQLSWNFGCCWSRSKKFLRCIKLHNISHTMSKNGDFKTKKLNLDYLWGSRSEI